jgi:hypothetical protein
MAGRQPALGVRVSLTDPAAAGDLANYEKAVGLLKAKPATLIVVAIGVRLT